jgi:hypothetical protein
MSKKIDPKVKERCVRQVLEHLPEFPSITAAAEAVAHRGGPGQGDGAPLGCARVQPYPDIPASPLIG